jgi:hypothetical protein
MATQPAPIDPTEKGEPLTAVTLPVVALIERTLILLFERSGTNRNLEAGSAVIVAVMPKLANTGVAVLEVSVPVEGLSVNGIA